MGLLSLAIWVPIVSGALLFALGRDAQATAVRWIALFAALAGLLVTLPLISRFDATTPAMQFQENFTCRWSDEDALEDFPCSSTDNDGPSWCMARARPNCVAAILTGGEPRATRVTRTSSSSARAPV